MRRWTKRLGFGAGLLLIFAAGIGFLIGFLMLRASLPQTTGSLALPGLERPVRVIRDAHTGSSASKPASRQRRSNR